MSDKSDFWYCDCCSGNVHLRVNGTYCPYCEVYADECDELSESEIDEHYDPLNGEELGDE